MAADIERFNEQIELFKKKTHPATIFDLMTEDVAKSLFGGFCYALTMRVAVKYGEKFPKTVKDVKSYDPLGCKKERELNVFHPVCHCYRIDSKHDKVCQTWTPCVALRCYKEGMWREPKMYRCHNQLWDMTYPIWVEGNQLGVIFGGQTLVKGGPIRWREVLSRIKDSVVWDVNDPEKEVPEESNQVDDVVEALREKEKRGEITAQQLQELEDIARRDPKGRNVEAKELVRRFQDFLEFGSMVEDLLGRLYELTVNASKQTLLREMAAELVRSITNREEWWERLGVVIRGFQKASGAGTFDIYSGKEPGYVQKIRGAKSESEDLSEEVEFDVCDIIPTDELVSIKELKGSGRLKKCFGIKDTSYVYKCDVTGQEGEGVSTVIVVHALPQGDRVRKFTEDFCSMVGLRANVSSVRFEIVQDWLQFRKVLKALHEINAKVVSVPKKIQTLEHISDWAKDVFGASACLIWEYDRIAESFKDKPSTDLDSRWEQHSPRDEGIGAEIIATGQHLFVDEPERLHEAVQRAGIVCSGFFPLQLKGAEPVGVMYLHFRENPHFGEKDLKMVDLFSYHAGLAIQLAELRERNERRIKDLQALRSANVSVAKAHRLRESLERVVEAAVEVMHADAAIIYPFDEISKRFKKDLVVAIGIDMKEFTFEDPRPVNVGLTQTLMAQEEPLWEKDVEDVAKKRIRLIEKIRRHVLRPNKLRSFIGIALRSGRDQLGVLYVFFRHLHEPEEEDLTALSIFGEMAATRIQLAKLAEAQKRAAEAEAISAAIETVNIVAQQFAHTMKNMNTLPLTIDGIEEDLEEIGITAQSHSSIFHRLKNLRSASLVLLDMAEELTLADIGEPVAIDLYALVSKAIEAARVGDIRPDVRVKNRVFPKLRKALGVEPAVVEVFINLLQNAAKAKAKTIWIEAALREEEKMIDVFVKNDGHAIARSRVDRIFTPFYSTVSGEKKGSHYPRGLWVGRAQINRMGGRLAVVSEGKKGTIFTVSLKMA